MKDKNFKISIVGMPQGGTTALYNIVNFILRTNNIGVKNVLYHPKLMYNKVVNEDYIKKYNKAETLLVKEHHYTESLYRNSDLIFVQKRNILESIRSRRKRGKKLSSKGKVYSGKHGHDPDTFSGFKQWCSYLVNDCYLDWVNQDQKSSSRQKVIEVSYTDYKIDPDLFIQRIYAQLNCLYKDLNLDMVQIKQIVSNLDGYDPSITFFSKDKITNASLDDKKTKFLSEKEIEYVNNFFNEWIK